jgi:hypothetical protein
MNPRRGDQSAKAALAEAVCAALSGLTTLGSVTM